MPAVTITRKFSPSPGGVGQQRARGDEIYNPLLPPIQEYKNRDFASDGIIQIVANVAQNILQANRKRRMIIIQNLDGANPVFIGLGSVPSVGGGVQLLAGGNILLDYVCPYNDIYAVSGFNLALYVSQTLYLTD